MKRNSSTKNEFRKGFLGGLCCMAAAMTAVLYLSGCTDAGTLFRNRFTRGIAEQTVEEKDVKDKLSDIAYVIDAYYYDDITTEQISEGLYRGILSGLNDPYSQYYNAEEYQSMQEETSGSYYGIGAVLQQDRETKRVMILHVYKGSPSQEAGLRDGDVILSVDGTAADGQELSELVKKVKGQEGTSVHIVVQREDVAEELEFDVERRKVEVPTVEYQMLPENVGFLQISEFSDLTPAQFKSAVEDLKAQGMTALIVDVRDNPGGVLDSVADVLDQVLPEGLVVYMEDKYGEREEYDSSGETYLDLPLAVLVNENSASASEIFAGAIKDYEYGTLIGTKTFGKGIVQSIIGLDDGSAVKVTIAKYFTPKGNYIHGVGISPDIELEYAYQNPEDTEYNPMHDNQVQKALGVLKNR